MNSQLFLVLNTVILLIFIFWFLAGRRGSSKNPTKLNMKEGNESPKGGVLQKNENGQVRSGGGRYSHPRYQKYLEEAEAKTNSKDLNILFNYNGHTWDAYEVFGLPAGSSIVDVTKAYQAALLKSDPESHIFLETAYKTILNRK